MLDKVRQFLLVFKLFFEDEFGVVIARNDVAVVAEFDDKSK